MLSATRYVRRCLVGLAALIALNYAMLSDSVGQGTHEQALRRLLHKRSLELAKEKGFSPGDAMEFIIGNNGLAEAKAYYERIAPLIGFPRLPGSNLNEFLDYLGYKGLGAANLETLPSYELMPTTTVEFQKLVAKINNPLFSANVKLVDFQRDGVLVSRFFAPKIVNYRKSNTAPGSKNPFVAGWRKLVRLRPTAKSDAFNKISEAYILFNFIEPLETMDPFREGNESVNNQVMLVPKTFNTKPDATATDSVFWILYQQKAQGYPLGYALNVNFDLPDPQTRDYYVPTACAHCHGHDQEIGAPVGIRPDGKFGAVYDFSKGVYPYATVNYLDTDQWYDMLDYDFPGTTLAPYDVVYDSNKAAPGSGEYGRAFRILRKLNDGALKQNEASRRRDTPNDIRIKAVEKWKEVHKTTSAHVQPTFRAIDMGGGVVWSKTNPNEKALLESLNRFCFRCHSSLMWSVFDKSYVLQSKTDIAERVEEGSMPQGRKIEEPERKALLDYLSKLKK